MNTPAKPALPELLPCPFCGSQPSDYAIEPHEHALTVGGWKMPDHPGSHVVECGCGAGLIDDTAEAVIRRWNQRAAIDAAVAEARGVPEGWSITRQKDGSIAVRGPGCVAVSVRNGETCPRVIPTQLLYELADAMLAASPQPPTAPASAEPKTCIECGGPLQWRCPACRIAQSAQAAMPAEPATVKESLTAETVPWPQVTRYSGGASHEGIGGRVWIRLSAEGPEVEYVPAMPAERVALSEEQIDCLRGLDTDRRVRFYEHDFYVLSNFSAFSIVWDGRRFDTSEHLYHYLKFNTTAHDVADAIFGARSAHEAFKLAERNKGARRKDWDAVKVELMRDILRLKVKQHEYVRRKLLATGDRELVEDSWRDDFWGWGPNRDGRNMLGKLWMEVRAELRGITPAQGKEKQG